MKPGPRRWAIGLCCSALLVYLLTFVGPKGSPNDLQPVQGLAAESSRADFHVEQLHPRGGWLSAAQTSEPLLQHEAPARKRLLAVVGVQVSQTVLGCWVNISKPTQTLANAGVDPTDRLHNQS